jgi:hypothetical protein
VAVGIHRESVRVAARRPIHLGSGSPNSPTMDDAGRDIAEEQCVVARNPDRALSEGKACAQLRLRLRGEQGGEAGVVLDSHRDILMLWPRIVRDGAAGEAHRSNPAACLWEIDQPSHDYIERAIIDRANMISRAHCGDLIRLEEPQPRATRTAQLHAPLDTDLDRSQQETEA